MKHEFKVNLKEKANSISDAFQYLQVGVLNNHMLNVLQAENRKLDFHVHERSDEMFYCIEKDWWRHLWEKQVFIHCKGVY